MLRLPGSNRIDWKTQIVCVKVSVESRVINTKIESQFLFFLGTRASSSSTTSQNSNFQRWILIKFIISTVQIHDNGEVLYTLVELNTTYAVRCQPWYYTQPPRSSTVQLELIHWYTYASYVKTFLTTCNSSVCIVVCGGYCTS